MPQHGRYPRPYLEIEYDRQAMTQAGCCRYVPVVVRLCCVPENARKTVRFERVRKRSADGTYLDEYEVHPQRPQDLQVHKNFPGYHEYHLQLRVRSHDEETGLIHIKIESPSWTLLSEVIYRFDSRQQEPVRSNFHEGSFRGLRLVPFVRTEESRDGLRGQYPPFMPRENGHATPPVAIAVPSPVDSSSLKNWWLVNR